MRSGSHEGDRASGEKFVGFLTGALAGGLAGFAVTCWLPDGGVFVPGVIVVLGASVCGVLGYFRFAGFFGWVLEIGNFFF